MFPPCARPVIMKAWKPVLLITACITRTLLVDAHLWRTFWTCLSVTLNCSFAQLHENSMQRPSAFGTAVLQSALLHSYNPPSPKLSIDIRNAFSSVLSAANCSDKRMHTAQERIADCTWLSCMQQIRKVEVRQNTYRKQIWIFYRGAGKGHTHTQTWKRNVAPRQPFINQKAILMSWGGSHAFMYSQLTE